MRRCMHSYTRVWSQAMRSLGRAVVPSIVLAALPAGNLPVAADFPERNIIMIVPFAPGGSTDVIARIIGDHMAKTFGRTVIIENDAGAGGTTPTRRVAQAEADGYTLIMGNLGTHGAAPSQYPNLK